MKCYRCRNQVRRGSYCPLCGERQDQLLLHLVVLSVFSAPGAFGILGCLLTGYALKFPLFMLGVGLLTWFILYIVVFRVAYETSFPKTTMCILEPKMEDNKSHKEIVQ